MTDASDTADKVLGATAALHPQLPDAHDCLYDVYRARAECCSLDLWRQPRPYPVEARVPVLFLVRRRAVYIHGRGVGYAFFDAYGYTYGPLCFGNGVRVPLPERMELDDAGEVEPTIEPFPLYGTWPRGGAGLPSIAEALRAIQPTTEMMNALGRAAVQASRIIQERGGIIEEVIGDEPTERLRPFDSPGRFAIQSPAPGGWITLKNRDSYPSERMAKATAEKIIADRESAAGNVRVVDLVRRVVVWPPEHAGKM